MVYQVAEKSKHIFRIRDCTPIKHHDTQYLRATSYDLVSASSSAQKTRNTTPSPV